MSRAPEALELQMDSVGEAGAESSDDFTCLRYAVSYNSFDCAIRTEFRTASGCLRCEQGRFNRKRHASALKRVRYPLPACAE